MSKGGWQSGTQLRGGWWPGTTDSPAALLERTQARSEKEELEKLRAVVGPEMPCGCYAVELVPTINAQRGDYLGCRVHRDAMNAVTPEYLAWREARRTR